MKIKKILAIVLSVFIVCSGAEATETEPDISLSAESAVLMEASTGQILYSKNCDEQMKMASTTKIMTALVIIENCDLDAAVKVMPEAVGIEGSSMYLKAGEELTVKELLYGLMLTSGNDAAAALSYYCSGSIEDFAKLMNERGEKIGLDNTNFENPHGLDDDNHYSSAEDLAKLTAEAYKHKVFAEIVDTKSISIGDRTLVNHNKLLDMYPDADGVKTGYTKSSGRSLVSSAERDGMRLIAVTLNAPADWDDHTKMLDYGFENYRRCVVCECGESIVDIPVVSGKTDEVSVLAKDALTLILKQDDVLSTEIVLPKFIYAPVQKYKQAGLLMVKVNERYVAEIRLVFDRDIEAEKVKSKFDRFLDRIGL